MRISGLLLLAAFAGSAPAVAQTVAPPTISSKVDSKDEHISVAIDFLSGIKKAVVQTRKGKEFVTYRALGVRFFECALIYSFLTKTPGAAPGLVAEYTNAAAVLNLASGFIYPAGIENYKRDVLKAQADIMRILETKDQRKTFYLLRNCRDYWDAQIGTVANAIAELSLPP